MTDQEITKYGEIQYLKGRLDELQYRAVPNTLNLQNSRKLDMRVDKYYNKLKNTSELAYHLHIVERANVVASKRKSQTQIKELLNNLKNLIEDEEYIKLIDIQLFKYE